MARLEYDQVYEEEPIQTRQQVVLPADDEESGDGGAQGAIDLGDDYSEEEEDETIARNLDERIRNEQAVEPNLDVERQRLQSQQ